MSHPYPDLGSASDWLCRVQLIRSPDTSSVWNFCARFSYVISLVAAFLNAICFVRLELLIIDVFSQCKNDDGNRALLVSPSDDDECSSGSVECQLHSDCVNTIGTYICKCRQGFFRNGPHCIGKPCMITTVNSTLFSAFA